MGMSTAERPGLSPEFRQWSVLAFTLESLLIIVTFLFLLFVLGWKASETMAYVILVVMVSGAILNIFVLLPWYRRQRDGRGDRLPEPEKETGRQKGPSFFYRFPAGPAGPARPRYQPTPTGIRNISR